MDKGDFLGRTALMKRRDDPALRQRVGLELEGKRLAREGATLLHEGKEVGRVCSGTFGPTLGKAIAMAYVDRTLTTPGTVLRVDVRGKPESARVVALPFYRRAKS
jgi:aminomethyltransferase